jgi:hypothetical protein
MNKEMQQKIIQICDEKIAKKERMLVCLFMPFLKIRMTIRNC